MLSQALTINNPFWRAVGVTMPSSSNRSQIVMAIHSMSSITLSFEILIPHLIYLFDDHLDSDYFFKFIAMYIGMGGSRCRLCHASTSSLEEGHLFT